MVHSSDMLLGIFLNWWSFLSSKYTRWPVTDKATERQTSPTINVDTNQIIIVMYGKSVQFGSGTICQLQLWGWRDLSRRSK